MNDQPILRPLAEPLRLAAAELAELERLSDRLQSLIVRLATSDEPPDAAILVECQASDLLSQRLAGMAGFLLALAEAAPAAAIDIRGAVMGMTLAEQAKPFWSPVSSRPSPVAGGEVVLFID